MYSVTCNMFSKKLRNLITFKIINSNVLQLSAFYSVSKSDLSKLRKISGFSFSKCKEALIKYNSNIEEAHDWLKSESAKYGWKQMGKLAEKPMSNGLIGIQLLNKENLNCSVMMELNCETDFVARNQNFHKFLHTATSAFMEHFTELREINTIQLNSEEIKRLLYVDEYSKKSETLDHLIATNVGALGENMLYRRAVAIKATENAYLSVYTHLSWQDINKKWKETHFGKYGVILKYKAKNNIEVDENWMKNAANIGKQISQHIVGLSPVKIGNPEVDKPKDDNDNEDVLIYQQYLHDENVKIIDLLEEHGIVIEDFTRFNCGELATFS